MGRGDPDWAFWVAVRDVWEHGGGHTRSPEESSVAMERGEPLRRCCGVIDARNPRTVRHDSANLPDLRGHGRGDRYGSPHRRPGVALAAGALAVARPDVVGRCPVAGAGDCPADLCDAGLRPIGPQSYCPAIPRARGVRVRTIARGLDTPVPGGTDGPDSFGNHSLMARWTAAYTGVYIAYPDHGGRSHDDGA